MVRKEKGTLVLVMLGALGLTGCVAPQGGRYNNAVYDAPSYDSITYSPKYTPEFYNSTYYDSSYFDSRPI